VKYVTLTYPYPTRDRAALPSLAYDEHLIMVLTSPTFRRVTILACVLIYLLTVMGGVVRATGSGLGCPDWPLCYGRLIPPSNLHAIIEFTHRLVGLGASLSAAAVIVMVFATHRRLARIAAPTGVMAALLIIQIPLGGVVVVSETQPLLVALHLGLALLILGCMVTIAVAAYVPGPGSTFSRADTVGRGLTLLIPATLIGMFLLVLAGAWVVGSDATFACLGWPLCSGKLLPGTADSPLMAIQLLHRYLVGAVSLLVIALVATVLRSGKSYLRVWAVLLGMLFGAQVIVGAAQTWLLFPTALRVLHLAAAAAVWSGLVALAARAYLGRPSAQAAVE
jgi:heme A synthase